MFEKFTEQARRTIFFARYEASRFGSESIGSEHLLLGILREDKPLALRLLNTPEQIASLRSEMEKRYPPRERISTSVDLPVNGECKRVLARAAAESDRLKHAHISTEHLALALVLERDCVAAKILTEYGVTAAQLELEALSQTGPVASPGSSPDPAPGTPPEDPESVAARIAALMNRATRGIAPTAYRDLTAAAGNGTLGPVIGREGELESVIRILSRRTRRNPVLIGEPGVGKTSIVHALVQRIADGPVPADLAGRTVVAIDASSLLASVRNEKLPQIVNLPNVILYVHGLFDLAGKDTGWGVLEAIHALEPQLAGGSLQCIATGTPLGLRKTHEKAEALVRLFEVVAVLPPGEEEAVRIVSGVKEQYEKFHGVTISHEAVETAVAASRWFLRHRELPDRAIDLMDEAAAAVKVRVETEFGEVPAIRKRIRQIVREMERAIGRHDFEKARKCSDEERKERENLNRANEGPKGEQPATEVGPEDIVEAVAGRAGVTAAVVKSTMQAKNTATMERVASELTAQIPLSGREWADALVAYLAGCSAEEAEQVAQAIRAAKGRIE